MNGSKTTYVFDGTLAGLLTAAFEWFERKPGDIFLYTHDNFQPSMFGSSFYVATDSHKARRVWDGLLKRLNKTWLRKLYCAYLAEKPEIYEAIFNFIRYIFINQPGCEKNFGNDHVLAVSQMATKVEREKHRMEAFIRFQQTSDGTFYCKVDPDFNVLPLILNHFKNRYADQKWIIYDLKRRYGLYYNLETVSEVTFDIDQQDFKHPKGHQLESKENLYSDLWKNYFKSTNIVSRKNTKLHVKHVPKRYWRYLTEKEPL